MEDLKKLLAAATPGPWKIERGKRCIQGPDTRDGDPLVLTSMMGGATKWSHSPYSEYCVPGMKEGDANAALIVAAVNALPELLAKVKRLEAALRPFAEIAQYDIGNSEANDDLFRPMMFNNRGPLLTVGMFRRARAALKETGQ